MNDTPPDRPERITMTWLVDHVGLTDRQAITVMQRIGACCDDFLTYGIDLATWSHRQAKDAA